MNRDEIQIQLHTEWQIAELRKHLRDMFLESCLLSGDAIADHLADVAVEAIADWIEEDPGLPGALSGPFTDREKWLRFYAEDRSKKTE